VRKFFSKYGFTTGIVCILILVCVILIYSLSFNRIIDENQDKIISALTRQVNTSLNVDFSIGGLKAEFPFSVTLDNVMMNDSNGSPLLEVVNVTLKADWMAIVRNPDQALTAIRYIQLDKPVLKATFQNGKLNWLDAFKQKKKKPSFPLEKVNLKTAINDCRIEFNFSGDNSVPDEFDNFTLPLSFQADVLLIDGTVVLHPKARAYWIDQKDSSFGKLSSFTGGRAPLLEISGSGDLNNRIHLTGDLNFTGISNYLEFLSGFVKELKGWGIPSDEIKGQFEVNILNLISENPQFKIDGELDSSKAVIKPAVDFINEIRFTKCRSRFSFPSGRFQMNAVGSTDGIPFDAFINMDDIRKQSISGYANIDRIPLGKFPMDKTQFKEPLGGTVDMQIVLGGQTSGMILDGVVESENVSIGSHQFILKESKLYYSKGKIIFPDLNLVSKASGSFSIAGYFDMASNTADAKINAEDISYIFYSQLFGISLPVALNVEPNVKAALHFEPGKFQTEIFIDSSGGSVANVPFKRMSGSIHILGNDVIIDPVDFSLVTGGSIRVIGSVKNNNALDLNIDLTEAKFGDLDFSIFNIENPVGGTVFGNVKVLGTVADPEIVAHLRAYDGQLYNWQFQKGEFDAEIDSTGLKNIVVKIEATGSEVELHAEYIFQDDRPLVIWGTWENIPLDQLGFQTMNANLMLNGSGSFIGDADDLNGVVKLAVEGEDAFGNRISTPLDPNEPINPLDPDDYTDPEGTSNRIFHGTFLNIDFTGLTKFNSLKELYTQISALDKDFLKNGAISKGVLKVSGGLFFESFAKESQLYSLLDVIRTDILPEIPYVDMNLPKKKTQKSSPDIQLDGELLLDSFIVQKESDQWKVTGAASGKDFLINGEKLDSLKANIQIPPASDRQNNLVVSIAQGEGILTVQGNVGLEQMLGKKPLDLDAKVQSFPLKSLARLSGKDSGENFSGFINGTGKLTGSLAKLQLKDGDLSFNSASLFGMPIENTNLKFSWQEKTLTIDNFELSDNSGFHVVAVGSLELDPAKISESRMNLRIDNFPLKILQEAGLSPLGLDGVLSLITKLEYDSVTREPKIYVDLQIEKPKFNWLAMDRISGQGILNGKTGNLKLGQFVCDIGESQVNLTGDIQPSFQHGGTKLDLKVTAKNYKYAPILDQLSVPFKGENMFADLDLHLTGTATKPILDGSLTGSVDSPRMNTILFADKASFDLRVDKNVLNIDSIASSGESSLKATGRIELEKYIPYLSSKPNGDYVPTIQFANVDKKPFQFSGFGANVRILFEGMNDDSFNLLLYKDKAKLQGVIQVVDGSYRVSPIPISSSGSGSHPIVLDLKVAIPEDFPVTSGNKLNITLENSTLDIGGSLIYPTAKGEIKVRDGIIRLLDRSFVIQNAELQFKEFLGIDNPKLVGQATTVIVSRSIRNLQGTENLLVTANIDAQLRQLSNSLSFTSNKGTLTENELTGILMRQDIFQDFQDEGLLTTLSQQALTIPGAYLSRYFESQGGFQLFQVGVNYDDDVYINLEYEIITDLFIDYYHVFSRRPEIDVFLKYKFREDSYVGIGTGTEDGIIFKVDVVVPID
jgi:hypothetical protein